MFKNLSTSSKSENKTKISNSEDKIKNVENSEKNIHSKSNSHIPDNLIFPKDPLLLEEIFTNDMCKYLLPNNIVINSHHKAGQFFSGCVRNSIYEYCITRPRMKQFGSGIINTMMGLKFFATFQHPMLLFKNKNPD